MKEKLNQSMNQSVDGKTSSRVFLTIVIYLSISVNPIFPMLLTS